MNLGKVLADSRGYRQGFVATGQAEGTQRSHLQTLELVEPAF